jgi:putative ABC transport system permease protein
MKRRAGAILRFLVWSAWRGVARHPLRAGLTMLGIAVGIAALVTMVSMGSGAQRAVTERLESMGANVLYVEAGNRVLQGVQTRFDTMTAEDAEAVARECPTVALVSAHVNFRTQVVFAEQNWAAHVRGVDTTFVDIRRWPLAEGTFFDDAAVSSMAKVAVLGQTVSRQLFPGAVNPVGQTIRISGAPFRVLGVLATKGADVTGGDQDDVVVIPWTTAQRRMLGIKNIRDMYISVISREAIPAAKRQITGVLRQRHGLTPDQPDDHTIRDYTEIADSVNETNQTMTLLLASVAVLSLLVGGINTMSIMLVTVAERSREIGVRLSVGARPALVCTQFLLEAVFLTGAGGAAGVCLGVGGAFAASALLELPVAILPSTVILGVAVSSAVGLLFGIYPAAVASSLDPVEALNHG